MALCVRVPIRAPQPIRLLAPDAAKDVLLGLLPTFKALTGLELVITWVAWDALNNVFPGTTNSLGEGFDGWGACTPAQHCGPLRAAHKREPRL